MAAPSVLVIDAGKSFAKLTLFGADGARLAQVQRANDGRCGALDTAGIAGWLRAAVPGLARRHQIDAVIPIGHGAAAAVIADGRLLAPVADYEAAIDADVAADYTAQRDAFVVTGSPLLPGGLNLGAQLHALERALGGALPVGAQIVPWPQYWAWWFTGRAVSEITSLGCHSDLWCPAMAVPSPLAVRRGWAARLAPMVHAGAVVGMTLPQSGLAAVPVHAGLHDSNAALLAARRQAGGPATVVSTGTWFVVMAAGACAALAGGQAAAAAEGDCLVNVDVDGRAVPTARWMGGRTLARLLDDHPPRGTFPDPALLRAIADAPPAIRPGTDPGGQCRWLHRPAAPAAQEVCAMLHAALMIDAMADRLRYDEGPLLVEGRFAAVPLLLAALATLRPQQAVHACLADAATGALSLLRPDLPVPALAPRTAVLPVDLGPLRCRWRALT